MKMPGDALYATIRDYLRVYLVKLRNVSEHTVRSHADALTEFVEYVSRQRRVPIVFRGLRRLHERVCLRLSRPS